MEILPVKSMSLQTILICVRSLSEYYQVAHWTCKNSTFFADHLLFERLYGEASSAIDSIAEKMIGVGDGADKLSLPVILKGIYEKTKSLPYLASENKVYCEAALAMENELQDYCAKYDSEANSVGCKNMVADLADKSQNRIYLLKQRLSSK